MATAFTKNRSILHLLPRAGSDFPDSGPLLAPNQPTADPPKPKIAAHGQPESCRRRASARRTCAGDRLRGERHPPGTSKTYHFLYGTLGFPLLAHSWNSNVPKV